MAAAWLLQALYTSMLSSSGIHGGGQGGHGSIEDVYLMANTSYGTVRGKVEFGTENTPVVHFLGIQYAKPPTASLRFKPPQSPEKWTDVKDALTFGDECLQVDMENYPFGNGYTPSSEDCLYLNVFTPVTKSTPAPLPVMVWIHGGGYMVGAASHYDVSALATKGVVVVSVNYRLDVLGFLSTEDDAMPGNYGMLDLIAALKWVKGNIAAFGGDPYQVTVFGESAGSSSISLLILSPLAKGLFQRAIMQSGVSLSPWAAEHPANKVSARMVARLIGTRVGCSDLNNSTDLLFCLQQADGKMLLNISASIGKASGSWITVAPRVERTFGFLPDLPIRLLARGEFNHLETINGFNFDEMGGLVPLFKSVPLPDSIRYLIVQFPNLTEKQLSEILESTYTTNRHDEHTRTAELVGMASDFSFTGPTILELKNVAMHAAEKRHYLYEFSHRPSFSKMAPWISAVHADEIRFVLDIQHKPFYDKDFVPSMADIAVSKQVVEMWTNFAKTGNPTHTVPMGAAAWGTYSPSSPGYLQINVTSEFKVWPRPEVADFYKKIIQKIDIGESVVV